jgi:hypothetical protein
MKHSNIPYGVHNVKHKYKKNGFGVINVFIIDGMVGKL